MASDSIDLRLRVILVTTRAALRHAASDPEQRRSIVRRGQELVEQLAARSGDEDVSALEAAHAELDALEQP
jgi:hypothetical protein